MLCILYRVMASAASDAEHHPHKLTRFFLTISIFIIGISVLAAYSTTMAAKHSIKKDDIQAKSLSHGQISRLGE